ncbi:universal stress protein [Lutibacter sp. HS1-25]|uniref:universal stress protein n=1 Tax=Lutibacter sp. HS1-25 TaxID=2485000 RepID=UPI001010C9C3|nr:universal stress protein [Lutibacter sp. HS1-25]RXP63579.1 universal stress protein [Lutibacter sp. HS1-25]
MNTILHATDFSENAIAALKYAHALSLKTNASLYVIHVFDMSSLSSDLNSDFLLPPKATFEQKREKLKQFCKTHLENQDLTKQLKMIAVENKNSATGIISKALEINPSLIVTGAKGESTFEELLTGNNTVKQLIEKAPFPVLTIPKDITLNQLETLVYATDFEEEDINAIFKLSQIAKIFDATIKIVHVSSKNESYGQQEMEWFKELINEKITYDKLDFDLIFSEDIYDILKIYLTKINADLLAMLERSKKDFIKKIFHQDLVKKMEYTSAIPLLSYNQINMLSN